MAGLFTEYDVARGILNFQRKTWEFRAMSYSTNSQAIFYISEVSSSAVEKICEISCSAVQLVLLTTHGTANETVFEVSSRAVAQ